MDLADGSRRHEMPRLTIGPPDFGTAGDHFTTDPDYDLVHRRVAEVLSAEPERRTRAAAAPTTPGALPVLTVLAAPATGRQDGVDVDDPDTWPEPPSHADGSPYSAEELMQLQDAGLEAELVRIASTNDLCAPA